MPTELNLQFPDPDHVVVSCDGEDSGSLPFASPLTPKDRQDLRWYLEVYGAHSLGDPDDGEAQRIAAQLPVWGKRLFEAVFRERAPARLFDRFQDAEDGARLLTVSAEHPAVLALPGSCSTIRRAEACSSSGRLASAAVWPGRAVAASPSRCSPRTGCTSSSS